MALACVVACADSAAVQPAEQPAPEPPTPASAAPSTTEPAGKSPFRSVKPRKSQADQVEIVPEAQGKPAPQPAGAGCRKCEHAVLPGAAEPLPATRYTIWSDLPEVFCSPGVLYTTKAVLPPDPNDFPTLDMRTQVNAGFTTVDGSFDVFWWHTIFHCQTKGPRRIVVYVKNTGTTPATLHPRQVIVTDGLIGEVHEMESNLGRRDLAGEWDTPVSESTLAPGASAVVAYSKQFASDTDDDDRSTNQNCFGRVRVDVSSPDASSPNPSLEVSVVGIEGGPASENLARTEKVLSVSAKSGEKNMDFSTPPTGCQIRRATGVFRSFQWRNAPISLDVDSLTSTSWQMALWKHHAEGCPEYIQTQDLILHPKYTRTDTIGNYHTEYRVAVTLKNSGTRPHRADVLFGKADAPLGLAWRVAVKDGDSALADDAIDRLPVTTGWCNPRRGSPTRSFLEPVGGPLTLAPGASKTVTLHYLVLGNSSLPYQVSVKRLAD